MTQMPHTFRGPNASEMPQMPQLGRAAEGESRNGQRLINGSIGSFRSSFKGDINGTNGT